MVNENNSFRMGLRDGMPVGIGYVAVSFAFGLLASANGITPIEALLISVLNLTSAGQIAALPIIGCSGSLVELALTQLVINSRYALMSVSLSQRLSKNVSMGDRFLIGFTNTDEIFAVAMGKECLLGRRYLRGLVIFPYIGWALGTLFGAIAGNILPPLLITALSVSMYAMFIAILVPAARTGLSSCLCILAAIAMSCLFRFVKPLSAVPSGFAIIIIAVVVSAVFALIFPVKDEEVGENE